MLDVPRSLRLAAWGGAVLRGSEPVGAAAAAVTGQDEPHVVAWPAEEASGAGADRLEDLITVLGAMGATGLRVALPAPGDVLGLPGPAPFNAAALEAGECVLTDGTASALGVVPEVTEFGSAWETGYLVVWRVRPVATRPASDVGSLPDAERTLRTAMAEATEELGRLDVARWRDDAAERIAMIRDGGLERGVLPPSAAPRCVRVLATALRLRAIVDLATQDDGGAVNAYEAQRRADALRGLDGVARRAMVAAVNDLAQP